MLLCLEEDDTSNNNVEVEAIVQLIIRLILHTTYYIHHNTFKCSNADIVLRRFNLNWSTSFPRCDVIVFH